MSTTVIHVRHAPFQKPGEYVYIGRPGKWGNPFKIGPDGTREQVVLKYEEWLINDNQLLLDILELKDKVLGCWCRPLACHGDVLARLADVASLSPEGKLQLRLKVDTREWHGLYGSSE